MLTAGARAAAEEAAARAAPAPLMVQVFNGGSSHPARGAQAAAEHPSPRCAMKSKQGTNNKKCKSPLTVEREASQHLPACSRKPCPGRSPRGEMKDPRLLSGAPDGSLPASDTLWEGG
ncbi:hypothetical protein NDU88_000267 [Pleurodeles waltl]|uniref:Uncharacterized protein n=1 Tax=Pleurodeles waltl TaxID=8319 RepID=A0AAV7VSZ9_PLEWA|nr:hypothetical protein NDU88_000267 [Pleurodeles waltl]